MVQSVVLPIIDQVSSQSNKGDATEKKIKRKKTARKWVSSAFVI